MLQIVFARVREDQLDRLRWWMSELTRRKDEVRQTFAQEGTRHEVAYLLYDLEGPVLVYAIEAEDHDRAREAFESSMLPIDIEHRQIMQEALDGPADVELLYDVRLLAD